MKVVSVHKPKQSVLRILHDLELVIAATRLPIPNTTFFAKDQPLSFLSFFFMGCFLGSSRSLMQRAPISLLSI